MLKVQLLAQRQGNKMMITIRPETPTDYEEVFNLVKVAFEHAEHTDGDEHNLLVRLRLSKAFIPELSLVAEEDGKICGQIMFTKIKVGNTMQICLAPIAVSINHQKSGIGGKLITQAHQIAKALGYEFSILIGHPTYYPRYGYENAANFGITSTFDLPEGVFMAANLQGKATQLNGTAEFAKEFFEK